MSEHASFTRMQDGTKEEWMVIAAEMMRPYISDDSYHVIYHHQAFQGAYYYDYLGAPTDLRL